MLCTPLVSCPCPFIYHMRIKGLVKQVQFWFRAARSGLGQSDCRTVPVSWPCLRKGTEKELTAIDEVTCYLNSANYTEVAYMLWCSHNSTIRVEIIIRVHTAGLLTSPNCHRRSTQSQKYMFHQTLFLCVIEESGHETTPPLPPPPSPISPQFPAYTASQIYKVSPLSSSD